MPVKSRYFAFVCLSVLLAGIVGMAQNGKSDAAKNAPPSADSSKPAPLPPERSSVTRHTLELNGQTIHYTATAGTLIVRDAHDKPYGSFFYVAYTQDDAVPKARPVTFLYNGGPGSSSMWLHMGSFGPVRIETDSPQATSPAPYHLVPNPYSLLDKTDLVFIDAMGTGFSRP